MFKAIFREFGDEWVTSRTVNVLRQNNDIRRKRDQGRRQLRANLSPLCTMTQVPSDQFHANAFRDNDDVSWCPPNGWRS
jgi:hypothetical protein